MSETTEERRTRLNEITGEVVAAALRVHIALGPGLLENAYQVCLAQELRLRGCDVKTQVYLPVEYKGVKVDLGYRMDMLINDSVVIELKASEGIAPVHKAQLLSYLKLSGNKIGLLINFHTYQLPKEGIVRIVNGF